MQDLFVNKQRRRSKQLPRPAPKPPALPKLSFKTKFLRWLWSLGEPNLMLLFLLTLGVVTAVLSVASDFCVSFIVYRKQTHKRIASCFDLTENIVQCAHSCWRGHLTCGCKHCFGSFTPCYSSACRFSSRTASVPPPLVSTVGNFIITCLTLSLNRLWHSWNA